MGVAIVQQQQTVAGQTTDWSTSLSFNQFDPSLGLPQDINVGLIGSISGWIELENLDAAAAATFTVSLPSTIGVAGPSGEIDQGLSQTASTALALTDPANLSAQLLAQGGATVTISYTYLPAPFITGAGNALTYVAGQAATTIDAMLSLGDVYDATLSGAQVTIGGGAAGDVLAAGTAGTGIDAAYNPATETLTLTGAAGVAAYQQVLRSVSFASTSADPSRGGTDTSRTVQWSVTDSLGETSAAATSSIAIPALPAQWTGAVSGDWSNGADWSSSPTAPDAAQDVAITQGGSYTIDITTAQVVRSLVLDAPGAVLQLDASLTVLAGFTLLAGSVVFDGGSLSAGAVALDGGIVSGDTVTIASDSTIALNGATVTGGTVNLSANDAFMSNGGTVTVGGVGALGDPGSVDSIGPTGSVDPTGSIVPTGSVSTPGVVGDTPVTIGIGLWTDAVTVDTGTSGDSPGILDSGLASVAPVPQSSSTPTMQFLTASDVQAAAGLSGTGADVGSTGDFSAGGFTFGPGWMLNEPTGVISALPLPFLSGASVQPDALSVAGSGGAAGSVWFPPAPHVGPGAGDAYG